MSKNKFISNSEIQTQEFASKLAKKTKSGDIICLYGELGAGKTCFTKGLVSAFGVDINQVCSPTFTLMNIYKGKKELYHFDLYRISADELEAIGYEEYFYGDGICLVEWSERLEYLLPKDRLEVHLKHQSEHKRSITVKPVGDRYSKRF